MRRPGTLRRIVLSLILSPPAALHAQQPATATVSGTVYDSLARRPFIGADVQLVRANVPADEHRSYTVTADSSGRYRIDSVAAGTYIAGFFHPVVDSLGIQPAIRQVEIHAGKTERVDLALPGAASIMRALCATSVISDTTSLLVGFVRDADTREPRADATVQLQWSRIVFDSAGLRQERPVAELHARANGWFAACGVPATTTFDMRAVAGADTSGVVPLDVPGRSVVRRDLYLGHSTLVAAPVPDTARNAAHAKPAATLRTGAGRLVGTVRAVGGRPVVGARVRLVDAADSATTSDAGEFALSTLPVGSQTLDVRAVGFVPVRQQVDLLAGGASRVSVTLTSFKAYLDTVRITGRRVYAADRNGFERRRRSSAMGRFIDRDAIDRQRPIRTTDLFWSIPGVRLVSGALGGDRLVMTSAGGGSCSPEIYLDGMRISMTGDDGGTTMSIVQSVFPDDLEGVEVYTHAGTAPVEYSQMMSGCGSILLWTRPPAPKPPKYKEPKEQ